MIPFKTILVTGAAGFIGNNFVRRLLADPGFSGRVIALDKLTYAGNLASLEDVNRAHGGARYVFERADICDGPRMDEVLDRFGVDCVAHFAAESHVDRSIVGPDSFVITNVMGTFRLLEAARRAWGSRRDVRFHHVSTDEVFGSLGPEGAFREDTPYDPRSPYSASKAGSDHLVRAYGHTYGLPVTVSNCSNNYGPYQFPEKLIPLMILNLLDRKPLPVYGDGGQIRDWLYVDDHCAAIQAILARGRPGETYNVGGGAERTNLDMVHLLCGLLADRLGRPLEEFTRLITHVKDRPGHDRRYAIDCARIRAELGWSPAFDLERGLARTVDWYLENGDWVAEVRSPPPLQENRQ